MQLFFHLLYHPFAWGYDLVATVVSLGNWQNWVRAVLPLVNGPNVLEIGSGPGHLQQALTGLGLKTFGLDESRQMVRIANHRLAESGKLARGRAQQLPFADGVFQTVIATFPAAYIFEQDTASETYRVLQPGGKIVILLAAWMTGNSLPERIMRSLFHITGQLPPEGKPLGERALATYVNAGLKTHELYLNLPESRLLVLTAEKPTETKLK